MKRTKIRTGAILIIAALLIVGLAAIPTQAKTENGRFAIIDEKLYVSCIDETIYLTGVVHTVGHIVFDSNGGEHRNYLINYQQLKGVSDSGVEYTVSRTFKGNLFYGNGSIDEYSFNENFLLTGKGQAENIIVHQNYQWTRTPDGDFKLSSNFRTTCE